MQCKYHLKPKYMMALWFGVIIGIVSIILMSLIFYRKINTFGYLPINGDSIFGVVVISVSITLLFIWRKTTFTSKDFLRLSKTQGVHCIKKHYFSFWHIGTHSFYYGTLDDMYIAAKIDSPIFAFYPSRHQIHLQRLKLSPESKNSWQKMKEYMFVDKNIPDYMEKESRIEFIAPIQSPYNIDMSIAVGNGDSKVPEINCPEIDTLLKDTLRDQLGFRGRIIFDDTCFRFIVIGGSWQGALFRKNIMKGFEISKSICSRLREKYPVKDLSGLDIRWDDAQEEFQVKGKKKTYSLSS